jgi:catechol 2,3-dioxygenase-like lactoylglutathione lyase family enzyme
MTMDYRLEVVVVPVSDVDRAKAFYSDQMGFNVDHDEWPAPETRVVQLTPPGSACSIVLGIGLAPMEPGSLKGVQLVVEDIEAAHDELSGRGIDVGEIQWLGHKDRPESRFGHLFFSDPDGNGWTVQGIPA